MGAFWQGRTALWLFNKFSAPKYLFILGSDVMGAEVMLNYQDRRLQRHEGRLDFLTRCARECLRAFANTSWIER